VRYKLNFYILFRMEFGDFQSKKKRAKLSLCLIKQYAVKEYGGVDV
jgi:hypothetical protein